MTTMSNFTNFVVTVLRIGIINYPTITDLLIILSLSLSPSNELTTTIKC